LQRVLAQVPVQMPAMQVCPAPQQVLPQICAVGQHAPPMHAVPRSQQSLPQGVWLGVQPLITHCPEPLHVRGATQLPQEFPHASLPHCLSSHPQTVQRPLMQVAPAAQQVPLHGVEQHVPPMHD
jgi:hypothetical protein